MEDFGTFWNGALEFVKQPIVIGGVTFTILGLAGLLVRLFFMIPKNKTLDNITGDLTNLRKDSVSYVKVKNYNSLIAHIEKQDNLLLEIVGTIKNEQVRDNMENKVKELIESTPHEIVLFEEKPKEKETHRF